MNITIQRCYDLLELPAGASLADVKNAYRIMTKVWHPDRFASDVEMHQKAEEKLKLINAAFKILQADLQKAEDGLKEIDLVYQFLEEHHETKPPSTPLPGGSRSPQQPGAAGVFQNGKKALKNLSITPRFALGAASVILATLVFVFLSPDEKNFISGTSPATDTAGIYRPPRVSHSEATTHLTKPQPLADEDKDYYLRVRGYDPEKFEVSDFGKVTPKAVALLAKPEEGRSALPKSVKYCVVTDDLTLLSEREPKPFGTGYKVKVYPQGNEVVVAGKVQIFQLNE